MITTLKTVTLLLLFGFIITSCSSDDSTSIDDSANSDDSTFNCDFGFEKGADGKCNIPWAEKFVKTNIPSQDTCTGNDNGIFIYNTTITMDNATTLSTTNLFGYTASNIIKLNVISSTEISLDYTDASNRVYKGTGSKVGNKLTINFTVDFPQDGFASNTCSTVITYAE